MSSESRMDSLRMSETSDMGNKSDAGALSRLKDEAAALAPLLRQKGSEIDRLGLLPPDVLSAVHAAGFYRIGVPERFGGLGAGGGLRGQHEILVELGKGNASVAWCAAIAWGNALIIGEGWDSEVAKEVLDQAHVGPPAAGSIFNPAHSKGVGRQVEGGYMVSGTWGFCSGVRQSAWLVGGATLHDGDGNARRAFVLIPRADFEIADDWYVEGMKGTNSNSAYVTDEVFVPKNRVVMMSDFINGARRLFGKGHPQSGASIALGSATAALEIFIDQAKRRSAWATPYAKLADLPSTQIVAAKVRAEIRAAEAVMERNFGSVDGRIASGSFMPQDFALLSFESAHAGERLRLAVEELVIATGSSASADVDDLGRFCRDIRVMCLHLTMRRDWAAENFGRILLEREPWPPMFQDSTE